jgi:penicillin-binding protein 2
MSTLVAVIVLIVVIIVACVAIVALVRMKARRSDRIGAGGRGMRRSGMMRTKNSLKLDESIGRLDPLSGVGLSASNGATKLEVSGRKRQRTNAVSTEPGRSPKHAKGEVDMRSRIFAFGTVVSALFGTLLAKLWSMQLISSDEYESQAEANLTREVSIKAPRGRILDRNGEVLVGNRSSMALVADSSVADDVRVVRRISNLLGMPYVAVRRAIQSSSEGAQSMRTIMIDVPERAVAYVVEHSEQFPGVQIESRWVRSYPYGSLACHLLGYTGEASDLSALNANSDQTGITYVLGDTVGLSGIESQYESLLQGIRGTRIVHVNADGDVTGVVSEIPAERGSDIKLTIDLATQQVAEHAIQSGFEASKALEYAPTGGAVVAMDCKTGEILAMASYPNYNPTAFISGISADLWSQLQAEDSHTPLLNRAINGQYPPASVVKPLVTLAGLEHDVCTYDSMYYCDGWWTGLGDGSGKWCWNHSGHHDISLIYGIALSCDVVFYEIAKAIYYSDEPEALQEMYRRWGLGSATGVDLPGESVGRVPDAEWKWNWFSWEDDLSRSWMPGDTINISIGQGDMLVTPMQIAHTYGALGGNATMEKPHLIKEVLSSQTEQVIAEGKQESSQVSIDENDLSFVHEALKLVTSEEVGMDVYFANVPVTVGGKSGTAEAADDPINPHSWYVAVAPMEDPQYVVCSFVEHGGGGGDVASSMCAEVLAHFYGNGPLDYIAVNEQRGVEHNTGLGVGA